MSVVHSAPSSPWYADAPLLPADTVRELGSTLVVAPHPDDEVLGCGGIIGLLQQARVPLRIVVVSDGAASHPGSVRYPPPALAGLRKAESLAGLACVGVRSEQIDFLGLPDGAVPDAHAPDGRRAVELACDTVRRYPGLQTVLLPWRRDPHPDHRAVWSLWWAALDEERSAVRRLEYPIWTMVHPGPDDLPHLDEARLWRLDISPMTVRKRAAILAHRSQTTPMIDDASIQECLPDTVLERFAEPWELFMEAAS
jgi:LmbE family N-acetylglucosaminyl deacetylase